MNIFESTYRKVLFLKDFAQKLVRHGCPRLPALVRNMRILFIKSWKILRSVAQTTLDVRLSMNRKYERQTMLSIKCQLGTYRKICKDYLKYKPDMGV